VTTAFHPAVILALGLMVPASPAAAATQAHIGSWLLTCPAETPAPEPCILRLEKRFLDEAGITGDLEVRAIGKMLVPVITLRGLSGELLVAAALASKTEASMQFGDGPRETLDCAPSSLGYICAPKDEAAGRLAAGLPSARSLKVRVTVAVSGLKPLPVQEKTLTLAGTDEALEKLRTVEPTRVPSALTPAASQSPAALATMADKALKAAGYPNGIADLQALLAKYRGK
jgi:hypothetical protein